MNYTFYYHTMQKCILTLLNMENVNGNLANIVTRNKFTLIRIRTFHFPPPAKKKRTSEKLKKVKFKKSNWLSQSQN